MSNKQSRHTPSPTSPPLHHAPSKLPRFFQKQANRDRSRSIPDPAAASTSSLASGSSVSTSPEIPSNPSTFKTRKSSKFLGVKDKDKLKRSSDVSPDSTFPNSNSANGNTNPEMDEPPVIIEPVTIPRPRTRSERPLSFSVDSNQHPSLYSSTSSTSRIGDLPTRLSGWFSQTFSTSSSDLPSLLAQASLTGSSPKGKGASALLAAAKHGKGHLDKAMRYILDSDSTPDRCTDPIWLLGIQHPGYESPPSPSSVHNQLASPTGHISGSPPSFRSSTSSVTSNAESSLSQSQSSLKQPNPAANWPPIFYLDFTSRVWLTYRSHFPLPIKDARLADLCGEGWEAVSSPSTVKPRPWNWGGEKTWSSDSGWGCMLRTGQSVLANSLIHLHLGRDWRRPPYPVHTADYSTYVQILTWFLDTPSPDAPFSVHRMALAGKEFGTDVGQWFGPSTAAGAIKTLVHAFPDAGLGVSVANDGALIQSNVYAASHSEMTANTRRHAKASSWGNRPVLLLLGIRLGIEGVNPIYFDTIKLLYTFPQSVGIAGGRPSSSYYFVGSQADNLFYLDPHHARPAIPLRSPSSHAVKSADTTPESEKDSIRIAKPRSSPPQHHRVPASPSSVRTASSTFSYHAPLSPSPLQQQISTSSASTDSSYYPHSRSPPPPSPHGRWQPTNQPDSPDISSDLDLRDLEVNSGAGDDKGLNSLQEHYVTAYSFAELKTFHCERVRKMPLSGLDPSMLIGFLCRDEADWQDFRQRVSQLPRTIFSVQDEPPTWPSDSDDNMGLESMSEPEDLEMDLEETQEGDQFFDTRSSSGSPSSVSQHSRHDHSERSRSEEIDTEEDPVGPVTPGPNSRFDIGEQQQVAGSEDQKPAGFDPEDDLEGYDNEIEDDWVDPSLPTPSSPSGPPPPLPEKDSPSMPYVTPSDVPRLAKSKSNGSTTKKSKKGKKQIPVPVPKVTNSHSATQQTQEHFPFPVSAADDNASPHDRPQSSSNKGGKRMHTARARDGGRTQSGGVKGILTDD